MSTTKEFPDLRLASPRFPITIFDITTTAENVFLASRFPNHKDLQRKILTASVKEAKRLTRRYLKRQRKDWKKARIKILLWILRLRLVQNYVQFGDYLVSTGTDPILHISNLDYGVDPETWKGRNILGHMYTNLRNKYVACPKHLEWAVPPKLKDFKFLGKPMPMVERPLPKTMAANVKGKYPAFEMVDFPFFKPYTSDELPSDLVLVNDLPVHKIKEYFDKLRRKGSCAIDTETMGFPSDAALCPLTGFVRLIQIGTDKKILIADLGDRYANREAILASPQIKVFMEELTSIAWDKKVECYFHNALFDLAYLQWHYGIKFNKTRDSMLISQMIYAGIKTVRHGLGDAVKRELGQNIDKTMQLSDFSQPLSAEQIIYACDDVKWTYLLVQKLLRKLDKEANGLLRRPTLIECAFTPVLCEIMLNGYYADSKKIDDAIERHEHALDVLSLKCNDLIGVSPSSSPQVLKPILTDLIGQDNINEVDDMGEPLTELPSTATTMLQKYMAEEDGIKIILAWRQVKTRLDYFLNVKKSLFNDRFRGRYTQLMRSGFGRTQCGAWKSVGIGVNVQNSSKAITNALLDPYNLPHVRKLITVPKGHRFIISDFSAAHARICCEATGDVFLTNVYINGIDSHSIVAATVAELDGKDPTVWTAENIMKWRKGGYPESDKAVAYRNLSKNCFYGYINGVGAYTFMLTCHKQGVFIDIDTAKKVVDATKEKYEEITAYQKSRTESVSRHHIFKDGSRMCIATGLSGRRLFMLKWRNEIEYKCKYTGEMKSFVKDSVKPSELLAFTWCSTEADAIKEACIKVKQYFDEHQYLGAKIIGMIHDEINVECIWQHAVEVAYVMKTEMEKAMARYVTSIPVGEMDNSEKNLKKLICLTAADK